MNTNKKRVLIGSPIHQKPEILNKFLTSLLRLHKGSFECSYFFINDNIDLRSNELLNEFVRIVPQVFVEYSQNRDEYVRNEMTHYWNEHLIWKVARFKNSIIKYALDFQYDYLFLIDSDLLLHPQTLEHLIEAERDIVSNIFWTQWQPDSMAQPQVWLRDEYTQWEKQLGEKLNDQEISNRFVEFIAKMRTPGLYEIGGLGACTLISRQAMLTGVNFNQIKNLSFWGEDRHFCIRAAALGFSLYVDTQYPAYHIYRDTDIEGADKFLRDTKGDIEASEWLTPSLEVTLKSGPAIKRNGHKLTLTMVAKNEGNRYLKQAVEAHRQYIDEAVIIDDGSSDNTIALCLDTLQGIPVRLIRNVQSKFSNEIDLRKQQWEETLKSDPDWILNMDADEIFEKRFSVEVRQLITQTDMDMFCFRLYDFWSETHYREDQYWRSHLSFRPFLVRFQPNLNYQWKETPQHCGRFPENIFQLPHALSDLRLKHYGWAKPEHRLEKYQRYILLDPQAKYGWKEQYDSIMDENPKLIKWEE